MPVRVPKAGGMTIEHVTLTVEVLPSVGVCGEIVSVAAVGDSTVLLVRTTTGVAAVSVSVAAAGAIDVVLVTPVGVPAITKVDGVN